LARCDAQWTWRVWLVSAKIADFVAT